VIQPALRLVSFYWEGYN